MKTNIYVDGFNLYYGAVKDTPYKWLDLHKLCTLLFPKNEIHRIRYFTALVHSNPSDPQKTQRQETFIRALETLPNLTVHYGSFLSSTVRMPLAKPRPGRRNALVVKMEEKGSDVNLASMLLMDGFRGDYEAAVVLSNDSDLLLPIKIVTQELKLPVGLLNPHKRFSMELTKVATFRKQIRQGVLSVSQLPETLTDANGTITKPPDW